MSKLIRSGLLRNRDGAGALEFAAVLPVLVLLFAGTVDTSRFIAARIDAEQAAQRGTDFALALRPNSSRADYIQSETAKAAEVPTSAVRVDIFLECDGVRQEDFDSSCPGGQDQARLVSVAVDKSVDTIFDWNGMAKLLGVAVFAPSITVKGDSVVRFQ
jgi:hypothetical protein